MRDDKGEVYRILGRKQELKMHLSRKRTASKGSNSVGLLTVNIRSQPRGNLYTKLFARGKGSKVVSVS